MSPSGWSARGDSNPDLHGLNVPRLPIAPRADDDGDHGRTRTATGQALDLLPLPDWATWPVVPPGGLEPPLHGLRARRAPFTLRRGSGANGGIRTRTSRLGRPAGDRYPTFASGSAYGNQTRPSALATRDAVLHTQAETVDRCRSPAHRDASVFKDPALASLVGGKGFEPNCSLGRTGLRPVSGPSARTARLATAPGFEPGPTSFGGSDAPVTPRCQCCFRVSAVFRDRTSP